MAESPRTKKPVWPWALGGAALVGIAAVILWPRKASASSMTGGQAPPPNLPPTYVPPATKKDSTVQVDVATPKPPYIRGYGYLGVPCRNQQLGDYDDIMIRKAIASATDPDVMHQMAIDLSTSACGAVSGIAFAKEAELRAAAAGG